MSRKPDNISQQAWDAVDSPPLTERMLRGMRPARELLPPALFEKLTKVRGPQKTPTKEAVSLRLDRDVLDHFRASGSGWQTKINDVLRERVKKETGTDSRVAKLASAGLKNPATMSTKSIKAISAGALTRATGRTSGSTQGDKKRRPQR
jgi:uncharacterized protein (DUF4415 family)